MSSIEYIHSPRPQSEQNRSHGLPCLMAVSARRKARFNEMYSSFGSGWLKVQATITAQLPRLAHPWINFNALFLHRLDIRRAVKH